ncbi:type II toxin-antitoxin system Phd/YefM family antitoxin [Edwardsiella piscicida]|uniref:type II toxin-antitoxin system Phd/YefM family antitoxin n=1 Tax=Edwardsiella piscicida TaxID=1263550 RepID=UPI00370D4008
MKTVTDAEFRANLGDMLEYLRSGESIAIVGADRKSVVLSGEDLNPEYLAANDRLQEFRERAKKMSQQPLAQAVHDLEKRYPALFSQGKKALSFEDAMKRTREKHAEIIKKLEDN